MQIELDLLESLICVEVSVLEVAIEYPDLNTLDTVLLYWVVRFQESVHGCDNIVGLDLRSSEIETSWRIQFDKANQVKLAFVLDHGLIGPCKGGQDKSIVGLIIGDLLDFLSNDRWFLSSKEIYQNTGASPGWLLQKRTKQFIQILSTDVIPMEDDLVIF